MRLAQRWDPSLPPSTLIEIPVVQTLVQINRLRPTRYWTTLSKKEAFAFVFRSAFLRLAIPIRLQKRATNREECHASVDDICLAADARRDGACARDGQNRLHRSALGRWCQHRRGRAQDLPVHRRRIECQGWNSRQEGRDRSLRQQD